MAELGDEHGGDAVKRGAALGRHRLERGQGLEALGGIDHRRAMRDAGEVAQHHAEAVIERHRDADTILLGELQGFADEKAVVEDVVMGQGRALGRAGGAAGELDVDRVVELQLVLQTGKLGPVALAARRHDVFEAEIAAPAVGADADERRERRQALCLEPPRRAPLDLLRELAQHADIVRGLEVIGGDERLAADLAEGVIELGEAIGGIDVDEDEPGLGGGELGHHPFGVVGRPDADAIARREAERQEPRGKRVDPALQFAIAPADVLMAHDECVPLAPARRDGVEMDADGLADERHL